MMRQLDYQGRVLSALDKFLDALIVEKAKASKIAALVASDPSLELEIPDFAAKAWALLKADGRLPASRANVPYSPRKDGIGRPVPNAVLKVPTGGGKTYLAVDCVSRVLGRYIGLNTGFVLWIVPNEAIYTQTLKRLKDRQHPYRQMLDRAAAGRVKILEKDDPLYVADVEVQLCVMLLMLQAANRETQESLRMFRDRGDVHGFIPPEGDQQAHKALLERISNLSAYQGELFPLVKESLGNALRIIRPVVVLDEGHKAVSDLAFNTLYGFNPCFVLELTATPQDVQTRGGSNPRPGRYANVLVEVTGKELDREGMIKMPLNLDPRQSADWRATLAAGLDKLKQLDRDAKKLQSNTSRYIRPIMLVQVERTGKDQRTGAFIHADDVKDWLLTAGLDETEIAVKTAETNDLSQPENQDLLVPTNRVRAIITKSALQEGWDCPFAYVLCSLAASSNLKAMTQLVGRILRQPDAMKTGVDALNECYVITHHANTGEIVEAVKGGLEQDGLGDLIISVVQDVANGGKKGSRKIKRRKDFASTEIYLPKVLLVEQTQVRDLDYETDILSALDWRDYDPAEIAAAIPENASAAERQIQRISLADTKENFALQAVRVEREPMAFDPAYVVRMTSDLVPNPFVGREIVARFLATLQKRGFDRQKIGELSGFLIEELRRGLDKEQGVRAEQLFKADVQKGRVQFRLRLDDKNWRMPFVIETNEPENARQLLGANGGSLERSLFAPVYENELNSEERDVAVYLDGEKVLKWWHRNVARTQYGLQGWRRAKIYPDFIFAVQRKGGASRITVLETKGDQLDNLDTAYKRGVLDFLNANFSWSMSVPAGSLELVKNNGDTVECTLVLMSEWCKKLPNFLN